MTLVLETDNQALSAPYPGRFLGMGKNTYGEEVAIYGITGRSADSQNRELAFDQTTVKTIPHDPNKPNGDPRLTLYDAMRVVIFKHDLGLARVVSNGMHTRTIEDAVSSLWGLKGRKDPLAVALAVHTFEPDKLRTPRIAGLDVDDTYYRLGSVVYDPDARDYTRRNVFPVRKSLMHNGQAVCLRTYVGSEESPESYTGEPFLADLILDTAMDTARENWGRLNKKNRVALCVMTYIHSSGVIQRAVIDKWGNFETSSRSLYSY